MNAPVNDDDYKDFADTELDEQNMEAVAANAEQGVDMHQALRHSLYIGWVLAHARREGIDLTFKGGNIFELAKLPAINLVIPYPPSEWAP